MLLVYRNRPHSYDQDSIQAYVKAGFEITDKPTTFHDLTVIHHSLTAQFYGIPDWMLRQAEKRTGKLILFLGNEYAGFDKKNKAAQDLRVDAIATQLPLEAAKSLYAVPVIEVPHALNQDYFTPGEPTYDIGVRGNTYKPIIGDERRNGICNPRLWSGLKHDCLLGVEHFLARKHWLKALRSWRCMPSSEGGMVGAKCITSRHFEAIGTHTCLVMYPGHFNGILKPEHYITLENDHSNLADVKRQILDKDHCLRIVSKAREYLLDGHTHDHRVKQVMAWA